MAKRQLLGLVTFDNQLLDGLDFCKKVYDLFDQVRSGPDGISKLRLRPTKTEKRLIEELIPISHYIQARYREGRRIKVRWLSGPQPFDAVLWSNGDLVKHRMAPRRVLVEVTTSVHPNEYLARRLLHERGGSFGVKGITRDKRTGTIISRPQVQHGDEVAADLATQIIERLRSKAEKNYSREMVLIINCVANGIILPAEWEEAMGRLNEVELPGAFREVFLRETVMDHSRTLYLDSGRKAPRH